MVNMNGWRKEGRKQGRMRDQDGKTTWNSTRSAKWKEPRRVTDAVSVVLLTSYSAELAKKVGRERCDGRAWREKKKWLIRERNQQKHKQKGKRGKRVEEKKKETTLVPSILSLSPSSSPLLHLLLPSFFFFLVSPSLLCLFRLCQLGRSVWWSVL